MKAFKLLLAIAVGIVVLAPSATATAQDAAVFLEEADGPDDECDLRVNSGAVVAVVVRLDDEVDVVGHQAKRVH